MPPPPPVPGVAGLRPEAGLLPGRPRLAAGVAFAVAFACLAPCLAIFLACFASKSRMTPWSMMCASGSHELNLVCAWGVHGCMVYAWCVHGVCACPMHCTSAKPPTSCTWCPSPST